MKKSTSVSIICVVVGLILIAVGFGITKGDYMKFNSKSSKYINKTYECTGKIDSIDINELSEGMVIKTGEVEKPVIDYWFKEGDEDLVVIKENSGKLFFERKHRKGINIEINVMDFSDTRTVVTLPKDYDGEIEAKGSSGSVYAENITTKEDVSLSASSGSVKASNIICDSLKLKGSSGSLSLSNAECDGDARLENSSGSIKVENVIAKKDVELKNTSGSINVTNLKCDDLKAKSTSGGVHMNSVTAKEAELEASSGSVRMGTFSAKKVEAKCSSGSIQIDELEADEITLKNNSGGIRGSIKGSESDYSIMTSTGSGSCNLKDKRDGNKTLDVSTTSGSIKITFD